MAIYAALVLAALLVTTVQAAPKLDLPTDLYPIMPWDSPGDKPVVGYKHPLESVAECSFTVAGFVLPKDLPMCEKLGLKAIVAGPHDRPPWKSRWADTSDSAIEQAIRRLVEEAGASPAILGYYLVDEPGTPRFSALAKGVAALAKYAPGKLAYVNLFPGYATIGSPDQSQLGAASFTEYLESFVDTVNPQFLSYDDYMVTSSDDFQDIKRGAVYFSDLLEVRRVSLKHGIPFWNTVCSNQIRPWTTVPSPANLLLQAYTTLAAGGQGIAWYKYHKGGYEYGPIDACGKRTDTWHYLRMVNAQVKVLGPLMNRLTSTGVFYTTPPPCETASPLPGRLVKGVESRASVNGHSDSRPPIMVGEFVSDAKEDYVMLVNLSLEKSANVLALFTKPYSTKEAISAQDASATPLNEDNGHWLVPGQGLLIRLKQ